ncbi:MAG: sugar phosphate isomerase/epimerase family protein [Candidatus Methylomirabilales bacterium]
MKLAICNEVFRGWPVERAVAYAAELGYDGVEIAPFTLADAPAAISAARRREIRRAAEQHGIAIAGLHWLLVKPEGLSINGPDAAVRARTQAHMRELIHLCADLGGRVLIHGSPDQRSVPQGGDFEEAWRRARETFEACLPAAQERGVVYCIEPLTRQVTNFINTVAQADRLVREIDHPAFRLMVDCRSAESDGSAVAELDAALASGRLAHVHVNDVSGRGPGFGRLAFTPVLQRLRAARYRDYVSVEVFEFDPDPQTIAGRSIGYLRGILEALGEAPGASPPPG